MTTDDKRTVLVVDDIPDDIAVLEGILRESYHVKAATDGERALQIARGSPPPDLIILDIMMEGMDGLEVCRRLKQEPATAKIPVIFVTAKDADSDESEGFAVGAADYVVKPINPYLVRARAKVHLELKQAREDLEAQNEVLQENVRLREEVEAISRHDLKNPLMIVMTVPQAILAEGQLTPSQQKLLRMVDEAGRRMLEMINRTIDLYKMERGSYTLKPAAVDVVPIVAQTTAALGSLIRAASLTSVVTINNREPRPGDRFMVRGEDLLVYSLLANLMKNAAEASPQGGEISIAMKEGETATVAIHNEGAIPESIRTRFFQKFATAGKKGGAGLGAYSAKLIASTLNGTIGFETSEAAGTTVTVKLPPA